MNLLIFWMKKYKERLYLHFSLICWNCHLTTRTYQKFLRKKLHLGFPYFSLKIVNSPRSGGGIRLRCEWKHLCQLQPPADKADDNSFFRKNDWTWTIYWQNNISEKVIKHTHAWWKKIKRGNMMSEIEL